MRGEGSRVKTHSSWVQQGLALGFVLGVRTRAGYLPGAASVSSRGCTVHFAGISWGRMESEGAAWQWWWRL